MHSPVQIFAGIRLNLSSVERFCEIACGLADDNPEIQTGVWEAAREARSSAQLIDHLRSLFSHQQCIEEQASSVKPATSLQVHVPYLRLAQLTSSATEPKQQPYAYQSQYYSPHYQLAGDESALLFTRTNQLNLCRASKCLLANIAKMLYLTDSVLLPTSDADLQLGPDELASQAFLRQAHNQFQRLEDENRAKVSFRGRRGILFTCLHLFVWRARGNESVWRSRLVHARASSALLASSRARASGLINFDDFSTKANRL